MQLWNLAPLLRSVSIKRFHEGYHFISMVMEVHGAPRCDMDRFIRECARLFHDRQSKSHLSLSFYIQLLRQCINIVLQHALAFVIKKKIMLVDDICSRCRNPSFGLATKAKVCKVAGQEGSLGITPHVPRSVRKCEGMNPHTSKGVSTLGVRVSVDSQVFREQLQRSKLNGLKNSLYHWKVLGT